MEICTLSTWVQGISWGVTRVKFWPLVCLFCTKWDPRRSGSLPEKKIYNFHSVTILKQAVVTIYCHYTLFLLPFNGNSMCNG